MVTNHLLQKECETGRQEGASCRTTSGLPLSAADAALFVSGVAIVSNVLGGGQVTFSYLLRNRNDTVGNDVITIDNL